MGRRELYTKFLRYVSTGASPSESVYERSGGGQRLQQRVSREKIVMKGMVQVYLDSL